MTGIVAINYVQNDTLTSRLTANYDLPQPVGPNSYNIIDTVANGIQSQSDAFNVNSVGSHLQLIRTRLTLNFSVPYSGEGVFVSGKGYSTYPFIWCPYTDWLDQDAINKAISWYEISGAFNYKSNDQVYRNPDTREIICHSYNKTQCEKYGLYRSPYSCVPALNNVKPTPVQIADWNGLYPGVLNPNSLQFYNEENINSWTYQQNLKTKPVITVSNLISTESSPPELTAETDSYGNIYANQSGIGPYQGTFTCTINIQITMDITDKLLDSIMRSEHGQSIRVDNKQLTYTFYYNQYYINNWLLKSSRAFISPVTGFGMLVKSNTTSSSLRVYGFTTPLPDNGLFTKPYYDWANQRQMNFTLQNGTTQFKIEMPQLNVLPSQVLLYASPQLWSGSNPSVVNNLISTIPSTQANIGHNIFGRITNLIIQIDNEIVNQTLDDQYFRRETVRQNMSDEGGFDEKLYRKIDSNYAQPLYYGSQAINVTGGVPYVIIDLSKLCLDNKVALVRNDRPKNLTFSGTLSLDATTVMSNLYPSVTELLNTMQFTVFIYELKPAVMRLDPYTNTITNDYITSDTKQMTSLEVQNQMAKVTEDLGVPSVSFEERLSGGNVGGSFFDSLKKFVLPILKPVISYGFQTVAKNMRTNADWVAQNRWMPSAAPFVDAVGTWVGSGKRRPMLR